MPFLNADLALAETQSRMDKAELSARTTVDRYGGYWWAEDRLRLIARDRFTLWRHRDKGEVEAHHVCRTCFGGDGKPAPWPCLEVKAVLDYWCAELAA